jgi:peptidoglycan/LPS O-acetylase OafA/YrhL
VAGDIEQRKWFGHLQAFRGLAILGVVGAHSFDYGVDLLRHETASGFDHYVDAANRAVFHGSTIFFTLISGVLFTAVLRGRPWSRFYKRKLTAVFLPYLVFTMLFSLGVEPDDVDDAASVGGVFTGGVDAYLAIVARNLVTGEVIFPFWYMPVLALLFLATPLLDALIAGRRTRWLVYLLTLAGLVVTRGSDGFSWPTALYFLGVYAMGMLLGHKHEQWLEWIGHRLPAFALVAAIASAAIVTMELAGFSEDGNVWPIEAAYYVQKLALSGIALVLLKRYLTEIPRWLDMLANYSFAIYFMHVPVIYELCVVINLLLARPPSQIGTIGLGFSLIAVGSLVPVAIAWCVQRPLGRYSRMLVGA